MVIDALMLKVQQCPQNIFFEQGTGVVSHGEEWERIGRRLLWKATSVFSGHGSRVPGVVCEPMIDGYCCYTYAESATIPAKYLL